MLKRLLATEPAILISSITAALTAIIGVAVAYGLDVSDEQKNAILGAVAPVVGVIFLLGPIIRGTVYSPRTTQEIANNAAVTQVPDIGTPPDGAVKA